MGRPCRPGQSTPPDVRTSCRPCALRSAFGDGDTVAQRLKRVNALEIDLWRDNGHRQQRISFSMPIAPPKPGQSRNSPFAS
ncbi:MAG: hypothetical protein GPOALKHO_001708 [Sodalis sp.]|nr:MAG: hypothetical protein GPOALKHO_001708 [Sodalis sp.]